VKIKTDIQVPVTAVHFPLTLADLKSWSGCGCAPGAELRLRARR